MENACQDNETNWASQEDISSLDKLTQSYLALKKRICSAHEVITQYNDKVKECERLKTELKLMTKQANKATFDFNTTLAKVLKVELQNSEYQKKIQTLTAAVESQEVKIAADSKHIQQLTCKISDIETQTTEKTMECDLEKSSLQVRIKELEQELRTAKKPHEAKLKKLEKKLNAQAAKPKLTIPVKNTVDIAVNTRPKLTADIGVNTVCKSTADSSVNTMPTLNFVRPKPKTLDKCSMTKEFYNVKDNLYPIFCNKCVTEIVPPPLDKICKIMKDQCPALIDKIRSPSPIQASSPLSRIHDVADNRCKAECLSDTCSHTSGQTNQNSLPLPNVLPSASPSVPLQATYFNDFIPHQLSNLMNQSKYFIPAATNTLPNTTGNMSVLSTSSSVVESLEKRIGCLETKLKKQLKKQLKKRKAMENSNCWQHKHPTSCCSRETGNASQSDVTLNLMQQMMELCNRNQARDTDLYKEHMLANLTKPTLKKTRPKRRKRLQSASKSVWKIEDMPKVAEQSCIQKKSKKRKLLTLFGSYDRQTSDHDMADTLNLDSGPHYEKPIVYSSPEPSSPASCNIQRKPLKPIKTHSTETDSGLSCDWVDSCRSIQCEMDMETCSTVGEDRESIEKGEIKSSDQDGAVCPSSINEPPSECIDDGENENAASISEEHIDEEAVETAGTKLPMDTEIAGSLQDEDNPGTITSEVILESNITEPREEEDNYNAIKDFSFQFEENINERIEETLDIKFDSDPENEYLTHNQDDCDSISRTVPTTSIFDCISENVEDDVITESLVLKEHVAEKTAEILDSPDSPDLLDPPDSSDLLDLLDSPDLHSQSSYLHSNQDDCNALLSQPIHTRNIIESSSECVKNDEIKESSVPKEDVEEELKDILSTKLLADIEGKNLLQDHDDCDTIPSQPISTRNIIESSSECIENDAIKESSVPKEDVKEEPEDILGTKLHADIEDKNLLQDQDDCDKIVSQPITTRNLIESSSECVENDEIMELSVPKEDVKEEPEDILGTELHADIEDKNLLQDQDDCDKILSQPITTRNLIESSSECVKNDEIKESSVPKDDVKEEPEDILGTELHADIEDKNLLQDQNDCDTILSQPVPVKSIGEPSSKCTEYGEIKEPSMLEEQNEDKPVEVPGSGLNSDMELYEEDHSEITLETIPKRRGRPSKKKPDNRQELLKKLKKLKTPKKEVATCLSLTENLNLQVEEPNICQDQMNIDVKIEAFTPRNRTRVAHTRKHTLPVIDAIIKPAARINLYERASVRPQGAPRKQLVPNTQETPAINVSQEAPISGRTRSCKINTRKRKISDIAEASAVINTKTIKTHHESSCLNVTGESGEIEMDMPLSEKLSNDLENVTQKDNINTQVLNLDSNEEKLINTRIGTTSTSDSTLENHKPFIKEYLNKTSTRDHSINNCSLYKYELQSSQVESNLHVRDFKAESTVPPCMNKLRKDMYNETAGAKLLTNATSVESHVPQKSAITIQNNTAGDSEADVLFDPQLATPVSMLMYYSKKKKPPVRATKKQKKELADIIRLTDQFVKKQLAKLINCPWNLAFHDSVLDKLKDLCSSRILAKSIIEFLSTESKYNTELDNTYTPPAPLMTKAQQRITPLVIDLRESHPDIIDLILAGIEYELFRPRKVPPQRWLLTSLTGLYIALVRAIKDREKMRIFCFDAMYFLHFNAMVVMYTVITSWPEVFPNFEATNDVLPKCMAHVILSQVCTYPLPKLNALKNLISVHYQYPTGTVSNKILAEFITKLQEKPCNGLESAIILLAKRENTTWTHTNLISGALLPLIIRNKVPNQYKAFRLLGNLLRPFPIDDSNRTVADIAEQLRDLIRSGQMEFEQEEGIVAALLSLSRQQKLFQMIADTVFTWEPSQPLRLRTREQVKAFLRLRDGRYWWHFQRKMCFNAPAIQGTIGMRE